MVAALVHNLKDHPRRFGALNTITPHTWAPNKHWFFSRKLAYGLILP